MIDKTYEIRLSNSHLKEEVEKYRVRNEEIEQLLSEVSIELK